MGAIGYSVWSCPHLKGFEQIVFTFFGDRKTCLWPDYHFNFLFVFMSLYSKASSLIRSFLPNWVLAKNFALNIDELSLLKSLRVEGWVVKLKWLEVWSLNFVCEENFWGGWRFVCVSKGSKVTKERRLGVHIFIFFADFLLILGYFLIKNGRIWVWWWKLRELNDFCIFIHLYHLTIFECDQGSWFKHVSFSFFNRTELGSCCSFGECNNSFPVLIIDNFEQSLKLTLIAHFKFHVSDSSNEEPSLG